LVGDVRAVAEGVTMTSPTSDHLSRRRVLGSLAAIPAIQALQGAPATQAQTAAMAADHVTAIDIALEPDATMIRHAKAANARLLKDFPKGFALDATHHPHVSMLQQFARTSDLDKVYDAAASVFRKEEPLGWNLRAFNTTISLAHRSVSPALLSSRPTICIGCRTP
jgi:hypothetical protein